MATVLDAAREVCRAWHWSRDVGPAVVALADALAAHDQGARHGTDEGTEGRERDAQAARAGAGGVRRESGAAVRAVR